MNIDKIQPFLQFRRRPARVILALLASNYNAQDICKLTIADLKALRAQHPDDIQLAIDEIVEVADDDCSLAFTYPNGRPYKIFDVRRILHDATARTLGKKMSQTEFYDYVNS